MKGPFSDGPFCMRKDRNGNTVHMWILIIFFVLLFLLLFVSMPLIIEARGRAGVRGAVVHAKIFVLGLFPIPLRLKLYLLKDPYFTLEIGKKRIGLFEQRRRRIPRITGVRLLRLDTKTTVGVDGEPAAAVLLAGTAAVLLSMLTTRVAESGSAKAALCAAPTVRFSAAARAIVQPVPLALGIVRGRIAQRKTAKNTRKSNEKRTTYASC